MSRARALALLAVLALVPLAHSASATTYRTVSVRYAAPGGTSLGTGSTVSTTSSPAVTEVTRSDEDKVTVIARDPGSAAVALAVDVTPEGSSTPTRTLACSETTLTVSTGSSVAVTPLTGRCADGRLSTPRSGSVALSFHKKPVAAGTKAGAPPALRWALVIGVKDYAGSTHDTLGGIGDTLAVRRSLIGSGWRNDHILTLTDGQATIAGIRAGLDWLKAHASARSFSLVHFSGHVCIESRGPCAAGHAYLWSHDNKFLPDTELVSRLKQVPGRQWLDLSACEGGAFDVNGYSSPNRLFTSASQGNETAYEEPRWNESVWTGLTWDHGYNQGLADPHGKKFHATIAQMASYGVTQAPSYTRNQSRGPQHPVVRGGDRSWSLSAPPGG